MSLFVPYEVKNSIIGEKAWVIIVCIIIGPTIAYHSVPQSPYLPLVKFSLKNLNSESLKFQLRNTIKTVELKKDKR